ncbi:MAG TPA: lipid biosynthesis B12-binding/radical SAM protein [Candidatus Deferrimicrobiaceae bacterium]
MNTPQDTPRPGDCRRREEGPLRVFLVSVNRETVPAPVAPLGLSYIAGAALRDGHRVELLDLCFSSDVDRDIEGALRRFHPDLVGISIRNVDNLTFPGSVSYLDEIRAAVDALKKGTGAPIVAGGPGFSIFPEKLLDLLGIPLGIVGEGEEAFRVLARALERGEGVPEHPNLFRRGTAAATVRKAQVSRDGIGAPARELLDNRRYLELGGMGNLQTKRGCPFDCIYCTYPHISGASLRLRPPEDVAGEMELLERRFGVDHVFFVDDIFNWPAAHAAEICDTVAARGLGISWSCFATPLGMTPALAGAMKRAGCRGVEIGTDAGSSAMLASLGKPFRVEDVRNASAACRDAGLPDAHYLIFGGPGETHDTLSETFATFDEIRPRAVLALLGIRLYPNTPLHRIALEERIVEREDDLLAPRFFISNIVGEGALQERVAAHAKARPNWVVPGLGIRSDPAILSALRRRGHRGPLWDML